MQGFILLLNNIKNRMAEADYNLKTMNKDVAQLKKDIEELESQKDDKSLYKKKEKELANAVQLYSFTALITTAFFGLLMQFISTGFLDTSVLNTVFAPFFVGDACISLLSLVTYLSSPAIAEVVINKKYEQEMENIDINNDKIDREIKNKENKIEKINYEMVLTQNQIDQLISILTNDINSNDLDEEEIQEVHKIKKLIKKD